MRCALVLLVLLAPFGARAASFQVNPIRLTLSAQHSTDVLNVTNSSNTPTVVQLQIVAWSQKDGKDVYTPSRALLATPPIFTVAPGGRQVVRVGLRARPDAKQEACYRVFLAEVPPAPKPGFQGVQIALRLGVPVFVEPPMASAPVLQWHARRLSGKQLEISAANTGNAHVEILKLTLSTTGRHQPLARESGGYILPGTRHTWTVKLAAPLNANAPLKITADTDWGIFDARLVPGK